MLCNLSAQIILVHSGGSVSAIQLEFICKKDNPKYTDIAVPGSQFGDAFLHQFQTKMD